MCQGYFSFLSFRFLFNYWQLHYDLLIHELLLERFKQIIFLKQAFARNKQVFDARSQREYLNKVGCVHIRKTKIINIVCHKM